MDSNYGDSYPALAKKIRELEAKNKQLLAEKEDAVKQYETLLQLLEDKGYDINEANEDNLSSSELNEYDDNFGEPIYTQPQEENNTYEYSSKNDIWIPIIPTAIALVVIIFDIVRKFL